MEEDFGLVKTQFAEYLPIDVERLPSGDYGTNRLILSLSTLAFNILRHIGQTARQSGPWRPARKSPKHGRPTFLEALSEPNRALYDTSEVSATPCVPLQGLGKQISAVFSPS